MKTRIIQTRYWDDNVVQEMGKDAKLLFMYLITCPFINISGVFEISDAQIRFHTGFTPKELEDAKQELITWDRVRFCKGWIRIVNAMKWNNYTNSSSNETAYEREINTVPSDVLDCLTSSVESTPDSSVESTAKTVTINKKQEIINNKSEIKNQKEIDEDFLNELAGRFPDVNVAYEWEKARDWLASSGKRKKDLRAFLRNWVRRSYEEKSVKSGRKAGEFTQVTRRGYWVAPPSTE